MSGESLDTLFSPCQLGQLQLANRIVMAPMTRCRARDDGTPTAVMVEYYRQRASAGLIVTEGTYPSEDGKGYCRTPGIVSPDHVAAWREVTEAVHAEGGVIVMQIMHCGRCSHADNKSAEAETVAPSAIGAEGEIFTEQGMKPFSPPRALALEEVPAVVEEYRRATENAFAAGFDGVELHGASGYLPAQFLSAGSNLREDEYGGSVENRIRFVREVLEAMASVRGAERVGLRICPGFAFNDVRDPDPEETTIELLRGISHLPLAYLHLILASPLDLVGLAQRHFAGPLVLNGGLDAERAGSLVAAGSAAAVSFGNLYIANPDLVERFRNDWELSATNKELIYSPTREGYADYPAYRG